MLKRIAIASIATLMLAALALSPEVEAAAQAQINYRVTIYNLTNDQIFSPPLVATHKAAARVFNAGTPASAELRTLAEDGGNTGLRDALAMNADVMSVIAATAPILPGANASYEVSVQGQFDRVSAVGMLVTTNDAFFGLDSLDIDFDRFRTSSSISVLVPAFDSGTETNNELCAFIPGPPCGNGGVQDTAGAEGYVHVHRGIHGIGDLDASRFDWRNPVAKIVITRLP